MPSRIVFATIQPLFYCVILALTCVTNLSAAKADEALSWKFKSGDKLAYELEMEMQMAEGDRTIKIVHRIWMTLAVGDVGDDGVATITQTVDRMAAEITPPADAEPAGTRKFDSKEGLKTDADKDDPMMSMMPAVAEAMLGKPISMKVSPQGAVSDVKIPPEMITALKKSPAAPMSELFTPEGVKQTASRVITPLPSGKIAAGKTWDVTIEMAAPNVGKQITKTEYKFAGTEEREGKKVAKIGVETTVKFPSAPGAQLKIDVKEQQSEGTIYFDIAAGRVLSSTLTDKMALSLDLAGMKREQVVTSIVKLKQSKPATSREL
ncbi:MAG TPA: DUF6263 family protein [Pirellulales bacterium]|jgi:hypothetical protein